MPKLVHQNPKYRKHRATGQAVVTLNGRDIYLGPHGTKASKREFDRVIGEWLANGRQASTGATSDLSVVELVAAYWKHAQTYYAREQKADSQGELSCIKSALGVVKRLYADTQASDFGPRALRTVQDAMVAAGWSRPYVNHQINRVRRLFRWAVVHEMVPASVLHGLQAVDGLRCGRTDAPEPPPVKPAPEGRVYAIRDHVSRQVFAMVELQILSGMRPGEVTSMRTRDVDVTGDVWIYKPVKHKTQHHGHDRTIYFGPKAKAVLQPYLKADLDACIFSPADAEADRRAKLTAARKTPLSCGNKPGTNQSKRPKHKPGGRYSVGAYLLAIYRGCDKAFPAPDPLGKRPGETTKQWKARLTPEERQELAKWQADHHFHPNQLRHNAATRIRKDYRAEAAQTILGHRNLKVTEIYAERNMEEAKRIMAEAG